MPDNRPIKIAIFTDNLDATGVVINAIAIAGHLAANGFDCRLIAARAEGTLQSAVPPKVPVVGLLPPGAGSSRRARLRKSLRAYRRQLRAFAPDILFSAGNQGHLASVLASWGVPGCRLVARVSNDLEHRIGGRRLKPLAIWWRKRKFRLIASRAARLVFVSKHLLRSHVASAKVVAGKSVVIPNGVDVEGMRERAKEACPHPWLNGPSDIPVVLGIGRFAEQKNFPTLLRAVAAAGEERRLRLLLIGSGPMEQTLRDLAQSLGIGGDFEIMPPVPNPMPYMARASVLVLPSWWEGSSNVLLEAIACATPVMASRTAGSAEEILDGGRYGLLVDPSDVEGMAEALLTQCGASPVRPDNRALAFSRASTLSAYEELFRSLGAE